MFLNNVMTLATETVNEVDFTNIFQWITDGIKSILSVCTVFPLNIYIGASVIFIGVAIYKSLKKQSGYSGAIRQGAFGRKAPFKMPKKNFAE